METKSLFQTVEDRNNPWDIKSKGPFLCSRNNAWLGEGFYYWDSFIELAHWWGNTVYGGKYVVCQSYCNKSLKDTYDLYNNFDTLKEFSTFKDVLEKKLHRKNVSVNEVLTYLKKHSDFSLKYKAIRAKATGCMKHSPSMKFVNYNSAHLELMPPVQLCVLDKSYLLDNIYKIVYPAKYK